MLLHFKFIDIFIFSYQMSCCVHLLDFYHEIKREELYVKYLKKLSVLHEQSHNWAEAGFTIMQVSFTKLTIKLMSFNDDVI